MPRTEISKIDPHARLKGTEVIYKLLNDAGINTDDKAAKEARYVQIKPGRKGMWILDYGHLDPEKFFLNQSNEAYTFFPNGFKIATYILGSCYIAEIQVISEPNENDQIRYRFSRVDETTKQVSITGEWRPNPSVALKSVLDHKQSDSGALYIGITYANVQKVLRDYFNEKLQEFKTESLSRANEKICTSGLHCFANVESNHIMVILKLLNEAGVTNPDERFVSKKLKTWIIHFGTLEAGVSFRPSSKTDEIIIPIGYRAITIFKNLCVMLETQVAQIKNQSQSKFAQYRYSLLDDNAQIIKSSEWRSNQTIAAVDLGLIEPCDISNHFNLNTSLKTKNRQNMLLAHFNKMYPGNMASSDSKLKARFERHLAINDNPSNITAASATSAQNNTQISSLTSLKKSQTHPKVICKLLSDVGVHKPRERSILSSQRRLWIIDFGTLSAVDCFVNNSKCANLLPHQFKFATIYNEKCLIGEVRIAPLSSSSLSKSIEFRYTMVDEQTNLIKSTEWHESLIKASEYLDIPNVENPNKNCKLLITLTHKSVQEAIHTHFISIHATGESFENERMKELWEYYLKHNVCAINDVSYDTSASATASVEPLIEANIIKPAIKIKRQQKPPTGQAKPRILSEIILSKFFNATNFSERYIQVDSRRKSLWLLDYGNISSEDYFKCVAENKIIFPDGYKIITYIHGDYYLGEVKVSYTQGSSSAKKVHAQYQFSLIGEDAQILKSTPWSDTPSNAIHYIIDREHRVNGALYIGLTYKNVQERLRAFFDDKYADLKPKHIVENQENHPTKLLKIEVAEPNDSQPPARDTVSIDTDEIEVAKALLFLAKPSSSASAIFHPEAKPIVKRARHNMD